MATKTEKRPVNASIINSSCTHDLHECNANTRRSRRGVFYKTPVLMQGTAAGASKKTLKQLLVVVLIGFILSLNISNMSEVLFRNWAFGVSVKFILDVALPVLSHSHPALHHWRGMGFLSMYWTDLARRHERAQHTRNTQLLRIHSPISMHSLTCLRVKLQAPSPL